MGGMRVADVFPAVSETFVSDQARRLAELGHDVVVIGAEPATATAGPDLTHGVPHRRPVAGTLPGRVLGAAAAVVRVVLLAGRRGGHLVRALAAARRHSPLGLAVWAEPLVAAGPVDAVISHFGWNARNTALERPALGEASLVAVLHGADVSSWAATTVPPATPRCSSGPICCCP